MVALFDMSNVVNAAIGLNCDNFQNGRGVVVNKGELLVKMFLVVLMFILLKSVIIYFAFNSVMPALASSLHPKFQLDDFKPITFRVSVMVAILFIGLFS
jgi:hypothetical protein